MIFNMNVAGEKSASNVVVTLPVPTTITTTYQSPYTLDLTTIDVLDGAYTTTADVAITGQTIGFKNNISVISEVGANRIAVSKVDTFPVTADKNVLRTEEYLYLNEYGTGRIETTETLPTPTITNYTANTKSFTSTSGITASEGVLSGFNTSNYVRASLLYFYYTSDFTLYTKIKQTSVATQDRCIFGTNKLYIGIDSTNKFYFYAGTSSTAATGSTDVLADTWYYLKLEKSGTTYTLSSSTDNSTWTVEGTVTVSLTGSDSTVYIGSKTTTTIPFTDGSIDMLASRTEYPDYPLRNWSGYRTVMGSYRFGSKGDVYIDEDHGYYEVLVSNGTISSAFIKHSEDFTTSGTCNYINYFNDGYVTVDATTKLASGFSATKHLCSYGDLDLSQPFEFTYKILTGNSISVNQKAFSSAGFNIGVTSAGKLWIWLIDSTGTVILDEQIGTVSTWGTYYGKLEWDGTKYTHYLLSGGTYTATNVVSSSTALRSGRLRISTTGEYWRGGIYLGDIALTVNSTVTWSPYKTVPAKIGYLYQYKTNNARAYSFAITGIQNPTAAYVGSTYTPYNLKKKITLDESLTRIIGSEDIS